MEGNYRRLKRTVTLRSLLLVLLVTPLFALRVPYLGFAWAVGGFCGIANMLLTMFGNERLLYRANVRVFVLSSFLRMALFGIIPVLLAIEGPWYAMGLYFAGFFTPLGLYAIAMRR